MNTMEGAHHPEYELGEVLKIGGKEHMITAIHLIIDGSVAYMLSTKYTLKDSVLQRDVITEPELKFIVDKNDG